MSEPQDKRFPFAKIVIILAIVFVLSLGLCGATAALPSAGHSQQTSLIVAVFAGIAGMLSGLGLFVMIPIWIVAAATRKYRSTGAEPLKLFDEKRDQDLKE